MVQEDSLTCDVQAALEIVSGKWKTLILCALLRALAPLGAWSAERIEAAAARAA
ncbi:hypothetical protein Cwoe_0397 [Conexibacter woesei DSM 14684]|uniref:Transcriptional regulator, HxlR family n=1 Tax=Conexibacter woesei (strain DSM 14684 / CCUG 47730 / CIP 108061 / JCM 11494 / NBRC 100937 / ID131577) TaxID=469383 RepID=D3F762_CONWI|nr:hypothetical protein Cwoe_0397 [Conexibacter woesei DSM 14684]